MHTTREGLTARLCNARSGSCCCPARSNEPGDRHCRLTTVPPYPGRRVTLSQTIPRTTCAWCCPSPPSINHQYATVQGRRVLSSAGRRFKALVGQEVLCALAKRKSPPPLGQAQDGTPLALDLRFYFESELRRDIDGGLKITQDAVCEDLGINDNRIVEVTLRKKRDAAAPRLELTLRLCLHPTP